MDPQDFEEDPNPAESEDDPGMNLEEFEEDPEMDPDDFEEDSEVFAIAFAVLAAGAVILTLNVLLPGGQIIFFQSLSLLGYCLFPLDIGALICLLKNNVMIKMIVVSVTLAWSSWAAYPFMSAAVNPRRKALALYPVFLMSISVGFLIIAID
ncbi:hypothetical protein ZIOFF_043029 [Zingiber officinale]|uniref:Protein YIP n=1 Tax=Zingiber officinale TaxID=94328 RepID=A0A8J5KYF5_ZINOF|nr:hypothetical protein ZIOFF_043029 [Zingiber officinale]